MFLFIFLTLSSDFHIWLVDFCVIWVALISEFSLVYKSHCVRRYSKSNLAKLSQSPICEGVGGIPNRGGSFTLSLIGVYVTPPLNQITRLSLESNSSDFFDFFLWLFFRNNSHNRTITTRMIDICLFVLFYANVLFYAKFVFEFLISGLTLSLTLSLSMTNFFLNQNFKNSNFISIVVYNMLKRNWKSTETRPWRIFQ